MNQENSLNQRIICRICTAEALHKERAVTARRADGLRMRREELLVQLRLVEVGCGYNMLQSYRAYHLMV